ncbi:MULTISPECIES: hypothetical protein [unclassified Janthinobacterium]|uniref:hypothetical protein n=1 Tax=unclassified Janthinobacterium TaxID=2610881 RepID=UPI0003448FF1|nr:MULTISPECIES: hypothetical protein [unclassified Janthinobacterium]MEC5162607.1 hypothetical protein [Janthinobacterium sp. CG_S6]
MPSKRPGGPRRTPPPGPAPAGWLRRHWPAALALAAGLAAIGVSLWPASGDASVAAVAPVARASAPAWPGVGAAPGLPAPAAGQLQQLRSQLEEADRAYCDYRDNTRYPNASRPIAEHPDQVYPNRPVAEAHAMRTDKGSDSSVQLHTSQSRVFMAPGESVTFTLKAVDGAGATLPLFVTRSAARGLTYGASRPVSPVTLQFGDDGGKGDAAAGDGTHSATLAPTQSGFAQFNGTIRTEISYNVGDRSGVVVFDVIYTPEVPATWSGPVRDALENGSLVYYLKAEVRQAGRYVVSGRVDDAKGKPFALASFNELLPAGPNQIKLTVFGKLIGDQQAALPLTLRDVDAYLLKEDTDPDRALMPRLEGTVHVSKSYPATGFADAEWQSEERNRYLAELGRDVESAKQGLLKVAPEQAASPLLTQRCARPGGAKR